MKKLFSFLIIATALAACKKSVNKNSFYGVWVESTLRLDTLDFDFGHRVEYGGKYPLLSFNSNTYTDTVLNPNFPVNHSSQYDYYLANNKTRIGLKSLYSSSSLFPEFDFSLAGDKQSFSIGKFYLRRQLPPVIRFERIR